ncbi:MAG: DUF4436 family protein [Actinomycetes bacterium]
MSETDSSLVESVDGHLSVPASKRKKVKAVVAVVIAVFAVVYLGAVVAFSHGDGTIQVAGTAPKGGNGLYVLAVPTSIDPATHQLSVRIFVATMGSYTNAQGYPNRDITVVFNAYSGSSEIVLHKGKPTSVDETRVYIDGSWAKYPLDSYVGALLLEATAAGPSGPEAVPITLEGKAGMEGWSTDIDYPTDASMPGVSLTRFTLDRLVVTKTFAAIVLFLFILLAVAAVAVAIAVGTRTRRIEPALLGWGAALLFALPALRSTLPGAPPIGAWIDILVFLWVVVIVILAYLVVLWTWVRKSPAPPE